MRRNSQQSLAWDPVGRVVRGSDMSLDLLHTPDGERYVKSTSVAVPGLLELLPSGTAGVQNFRGCTGRGYRPDGLL